MSGTSKGVTVGTAVEKRDLGTVCPVAFGPATKHGEQVPGQRRVDDPNTLARPRRGTSFQHGLRASLRP